MFVMAVTKPGKEDAVGSPPGHPGSGARLGVVSGDPAEKDGTWQFERTTYANSSRWACSPAPGGRVHRFVRGSGAQDSQGLPYRALPRWPGPCAPLSARDGGRPRRFGLSHAESIGDVQELPEEPPAGADSPG